MGSLTPQWALLATINLIDIFNAVMEVETLFPVIMLDDDVREFPEQLGTKEKFWLHMDRRRYLFKIGRPGTGENWAEKISAELAELLGLPHARYDFAVWQQKKGVLSPAIVPADGRLILGNELLAAIHTDYPKDEVRRVKDHTLGRIHALLTHPAIGFPSDWQPPDQVITSAYDLFLGYLLLDVWIANQDRHHENWGLISHQGKIYLAPTFDHAASLGQNETDQVRFDRLTTKDKGRHISAYVEKARSAIYENKSSKVPLLTLELFAKAKSRSPQAGLYWLDRLNRISENACQSQFDKLPYDEITSVAKYFAMAMLKLNKKRLLKH